MVRSLLAAFTIMTSAHLFASHKHLFIWTNITLYMGDGGEKGFSSKVADVAVVIAVIDDANLLAEQANLVNHLLLH